MRLSRDFRVARPRDEVVARLLEDDALTSLFADSDTEIIESTPDRKTTRTRYTALGREGVATFHFTFLVDGNVRFEKVCDGKVWRSLDGALNVEEEGDGARIEIEMEGRTKSFVPEFTIKLPMEEQIRQMADALRDHLEGGPSA
ncbi:MAG: hypothetical protein MJE66_14400 [Proteobacteria bacterium]|nr:hypothetical protein [Pseudomonadota bacterium]